MERAETTSRAKLLVIAALATIASLVILGIAFESGVQNIDADELVARKDDARAFFAADYVFIAIYAVLLPLAMWRYGAALTGGSPPAWIKLGALLLVAGGLFDAIENALLLSATDSVSEDAVDAANAVAIPKYALGGAGTILAAWASVQGGKALWKERASSR